MNKIWKLCAAGLFLASTSLAASINWDPAQTISGDTDVSTTGAQVFGVSFTTATTGSRTVNGEVFNFYNTGAGRGDATNTANTIININSYMTDTFINPNAGAFGTGVTFNMLSLEYQKVIADALYNSPGSNAITFANLTVGNEYEVQLWVADCRNNLNGTSVLELDGDGTFGSGTMVDFNVANDLSNAQSGTFVADGIGQWITGAFVADSTNQTFRMDGYRADAITNTAVMVALDTKRQLQALQLRITDGASAVITPSATSGYTPLEVEFDGSRSFSSGTITNYSWTFGDGNTANGMLVTNTYTSENDFTASLTVMDDQGNTTSDSVLITVEDEPLVAVATATPTSGIEPLVVAFDGSASTASAGGTISSYSWNFGDGNTDSGAMVSNTYMTNGIYTAELVVNDSNGQSDTNTVSITVTPAPIMVTWGSAQDIVGDSDVSLNGTAVFAAAFRVAGDVTVNGVVFSGGGTAGTMRNSNVYGTNLVYQVGSNADTAFANNTSSFTNLTAAYQNLLKSALYQPPSAGLTETLTLGNLTVGKTYELQLWVNDPRDANVKFAGRTETVDGTTKMFYNAAGSGGEPGQYVTGTFTANWITQDFTLVAAHESNATLASFQLNALQLRDITASDIGDVTIGVSGSDVVLTWESGVICDVWTNADLAFPSWGAAESGVSSPVTNAIGSEPQLFYELRY